jgi:RIP metalloprotease RseP
VLGAPDQRFSGTVSGVQDAALAAPGSVAASWKLGLGPGEQGRSLPAALVAGFREVPTQISGTFTGVYSLITNPNTGGVLGPNGVSGPVGIVRITNVVAKSGWLNLIGWMGSLSIALGVFNLLPIPFLDGGRFVFIVIEALRRRRVRPQLEMAVHYAGLMVLLTFVIVVTIHDIQGNQ